MTSIFDDLARYAKGHWTKSAHSAGPRLKPGTPAQLRPQEETPPAGGSNPAGTTQQTKHNTAGYPSNRLPDPTCYTAVNKGKGESLSRSEQIRSTERRNQSSCSNYAASRNNATKFLFCCVGDRQLYQLTAFCRQLSICLIFCSPVCCNKIAVVVAFVFCFPTPLCVCFDT